MVHIYCGDGKGKTTAAMGLALRMAGAGNRVVVGQFFKDGSSSELALLKALPGVTVRHCDTVKGRFVNLSDEERQLARRDYTAFLRELLAVDCDCLVLDEAVSACNHGVIPEDEVTAYLKRWGIAREIILTGRNPSRTLFDCADYVTEMVKRRHPFDSGIPARRGVEY